MFFLFKDSYTALHIAVEHCKPLAVQTLLGFGAKVELKGGKVCHINLHWIEFFPVNKIHFWINFLNTQMITLNENVWDLLFQGVIPATPQPIRYKYLDTGLHLTHANPVLPWYYMLLFHPKLLLKYNFAGTRDPTPHSSKNKRGWKMCRDVGEIRCRCKCDQRGSW